MPRTEPATSNTNAAAVRAEIDTGFVMLTSYCDDIDTTVATKADDSAVVHDTGNETIAGTKTFSTIPELPASDPTTGNQASRKAYVDTKMSLTGDESVAGIKTFTSIPVLPASNPSTANQAARKTYVDSYAARGYYTNLKVVYASDTTLTITADEVMLSDGTNDLLIHTLSETLDTAGTGANGLDTGTLAASTTYHVYAIAKADGTKDTVMSTAATWATVNKTNLTGYTYGRRISVWRTDGSTHLLAVDQIDNTFILRDAAQVSTGNTAQSWVNQDISPWTGALESVAFMSIIVNAPAASCLLRLRTDGTSGATGAFYSAELTACYGGVSGFVKTSTSGIVELYIEQNSAAFYVRLMRWTIQL